MKVVYERVENVTHEGALRIDAAARKDGDIKCLYPGCPAGGRGPAGFRTFRFLKLHVMQHRMRGDARPRYDFSYPYRSERHVPVPVMVLREGAAGYVQPAVVVTGDDAGPASSPYPPLEGGGGESMRTPAQRHAHPHPRGGGFTSSEATSTPQAAPPLSTRRYPAPRRPQHPGEGDCGPVACGGVLTPVGAGTPVHPTPVAAAAAATGATPRCMDVSITAEKNTASGAGSMVGETSSGTRHAPAGERLESMGVDADAAPAPPGDARGTSGAGSEGELESASSLASLSPSAVSGNEGGRAEEKEETGMQAAPVPTGPAVATAAATNPSDEGHACADATVDPPAESDTMTGDPSPDSDEEEEEIRTGGGVDGIAAPGPAPTAAASQTSNASSPSGAHAQPPALTSVHARHRSNPLEADRGGGVGGVVGGGSSMGSTARRSQQHAQPQQRSGAHRSTSAVSARANGPHPAHPMPAAEGIVYNDYPAVREVASTYSASSCAGWSTGPPPNSVQRRASGMITAVMRRHQYERSPICCYCAHSVQPAYYYAHLAHCHELFRGCLVRAFLPPRKYDFAPPSVDFTVDLDAHNAAALALHKHTNIECSGCGEFFQVWAPPDEVPAFRAHEVACIGPVNAEGYEQRGPRQTRGRRRGERGGGRGAQSQRHIAVP